MINTFCLPIVAESFEIVKHIVRDNSERYSYFEIWLDYLKDFELSALKAFVESAPEKFILLFRRKELLPIEMNIEQRRAVIDALSGIPLFIDLDVTTQKEELEYFASEKRALQLLLSYHNYERTPLADEFERLKNEMIDARPSMCKFATRCVNEQDALRLLTVLLQLKREGVRPIVLGMGEHGAITRIFGTLWGNEMNFAPLHKKDATAPGQFTHEQLSEILKRIEIGMN